MHQQGGSYEPEDLRNDHQHGYRAGRVRRRGIGAEFSQRHGHRHGAARRGRAQGRAGRGRSRHRSPARALSGRLRRGRRLERARAHDRRAVPHRLDDQAGHLARLDAADRAGPPRPRRSGRKVSAGTREPESVRIVRSGDRRLSAASGSTAGDRAALPHPLLGARLSVHQRDLARFQAAGRRKLPVRRSLAVRSGERWHYSTSTDVVGKLVEKVSGQKLVDYFRQHIFAPLQMSDTSYNVPQEKGPRLVAAQQRAGDLMDGAIVLQSPQPGLTIAEPIGGGGLASTANDYGRFVRALLNGGELDGARVAKAETVALMGQNAMGALRVPALKTALPRSADFTFIADGRDQWGLGFLITADQVPGKRSPGSLSWGGINNTYFWIDPARGISGVILMQYLPFADAKALAVYDAFERGAYQLVSAER